MLSVFNGLDVAVLESLNVLARHSSVFDWAVRVLANNPLVKGVPAALLFYFLWHSPSPDLDEKRKRLLALLPIGFLAVAVGRILALSLPFRERPLRNPELSHLDNPYSVSREVLDGWSSFPSDHAVLFAALVASFWLVRRWAGILLALHALVIIAFARVFLLFHYPTDIAGGAFVGVAITILAMPPLLHLINRLKLLELGERWPQLMYPFIFVVLFEIASLFGGLRDLLNAFVDLVT